MTASGAYPATQAEAYIVLADLQSLRGHLPLAGDAAQRAIALSAEASPKTQGWAWMVHARVHFLSRRYEEARLAFLEARKYARESDDVQHLTHIEGDVGMCWMEMGRFGEARKWVTRAVDLARQQSQPALEASWLVELGKIALREDSPDEADTYAQAALRIAKPREHHLTVFRAEWLRHRIQRRTRPSHADRHRLAFLRKLFLHLDQHEGIEEIRAFKDGILRAAESENRKKP